MNEKISRSTLEIIAKAHLNVAFNCKGYDPIEFRKTIWIECIRLCNDDPSLLQDVCIFLSTTDSFKAATISNECDAIV